MQRVNTIGSLQATILRCLSHPSVVSLVAVGIRPPVILLELAPCGTLGTLIKKGTRDLKMPLQHRIATQVQYWCLLN